MSHEVNSKESSLESQLEKNEDDLKMKDSQGGEGVDFDGDIEDSDVEMETHYYPISSENNSEFTVTANNLEELRRYARKYKKQQVKTNNRLNTINLEHLSTASNPPTSVSGSQDSDDDDLEDVSSETETPSIEKSLGFGLTSASTESLDFFVKNTAVLNAAKQTKTDIEKMKKREELKKRLEDTRRTLKIVLWNVSVTFENESKHLRFVTISGKN
ncbi:hypothetical protein Phum_PHUM235960 [Pediculus humanus corporis]|uniref:Uncharacterized protein n=1 Tax=Pediculus humanus subsp. corporis TaxID=121224 RepID=E0VIZ2_PEDHC|nr:uncharacterized protein Phum_PHUM235960 [Pediculus humanus corporis]EEB13348.1 hypothetical protein Phum_PHUM235960 [Pediculus humanus corporis]